MADGGGPSQMAVLSLGCLGVIFLVLVLYLLWTTGDTADASPLPTPVTAAR
jgi:hypothetical protein